MSDEAKQENQENPDKEQKRYEGNMAKLAAVLGGKENIFPTKRISKNATATLAQELVKERKEALSKSVKTELAELLDKRIQMEKEFKQKEDELKKLKVVKTKEFNEAAAKVFQKIEDIDQIERDYEVTLKGASQGTA